MGCLLPVIPMDADEAHGTPGQGSFNDCGGYTGIFAPSEGAGVSLEEVAAEAAVPSASAADHACSRLASQSTSMAHCASAASMGFSAMSSCCCRRSHHPRQHSTSVVRATRANRFGNIAQMNIKHKATPHDEPQCNQLGAGGSGSLSA